MPPRPSSSRSARNTRADSLELKDESFILMRRGGALLANRSNSLGPLSGSEPAVWLREPVRFRADQPASRRTPLKTSLGGALFLFVGVVSASLLVRRIHQVS